MRFVPRPDEQALSANQRPAGLPRVLLVLIGVAAALLSLALLKEVGGIIAPIFLAVNLVITAYPLHRWLVSKGTPSWLSAMVLLLTVMVFLLAAVAGLVWSVGAMVNELPKYTADYWRLYQDTLNWAAGLGFDESALRAMVARIDPNSVVSFLTSLASRASGIAGVMAMIVAAVIFVVMDTPSFGRRIRALKGSHPAFVEAMYGFADGVRRYWLVTTIFGLIVALLDWVALAALGVPLAMVWALLSFLTNYIPNIGFIIGLIPPAFIALFSNGWKTAVLVIVIYSVLNFVVQSIIQPRFTGESVGVTPTVSFFSLLLWGWVLGGVGTLVALPMTLLVKALIVDIDPAARWFNTLISSHKSSYSDD